MNNIKTASRFFIVLVAGGIMLTSCGSSTSNSSIKTSVDSTSATGPAPDNNSANNPSSADTNYQKDSGRKAHDTPLKRNDIPKP